MLTETAQAAAIVAAFFSTISFWVALATYRAQRRRWVEEDERRPAHGKAAFKVHLVERLGRCEWRELVIINTGEAPFQIDGAQFHPSGVPLGISTGDRLLAPIRGDVVGRASLAFRGVRVWTYDRDAAAADRVLRINAAGAVFEVPVADATIEATAARKVRD